MIGRAALGRPWIFASCVAAMIAALEAENSRLANENRSLWTTVHEYQDAAVAAAHGCDEPTLQRAVARGRAALLAARGYLRHPGLCAVGLSCRQVEHHRAALRIRALRQRNPI